MPLNCTLKQMVKWEICYVCFTAIHKTKHKTMRLEGMTKGMREKRKKKKSQDWALRCSKCLESLWLKKLYWLWPTVWKIFSILTPYMNMRAHTWNRNFTKEYLLSLHVIFSDILSFISFLVFYKKKKKCLSNKKKGKEDKY